MRIVTRADFDGVVCVVLLKRVFGEAVPVVWVEPNDMDRGAVTIKKGDIIANLPFNPNASFWFDHHVSNGVDHVFEGLFKIAPSAAGVIAEYYHHELTAFDELVKFTDKIDSAQLTLDEIQYPEKYPYIILSMTLNADAGSRNEHLQYLIDTLGRVPVETILNEPRVKKRVASVIQDNLALKEHLVANASVQNGVVLVDNRSRANVPTGNRFLVYSLFPDAFVSVIASIDTRSNGHVIIRLGHSIINRNCRVNVGNLLATYGGGGHRGAGSCRVTVERADETIREFTAILVENSGEE